MSLAMAQQALDDATRRHCEARARWETLLQEQMLLDHRIRARPDAVGIGPNSFGQLLVKETPTERARVRALKDQIHEADHEVRQTMMHLDLARAGLEHERRVARVA